MKFYAEHPDSEETIEVIAASEFEKQLEEERAKLAEEQAKLQEELESVRTEAEKYKKVSAEKTENFKKLRDMTEEERSALNANQIELIRRNETVEEQLEALKTQLSEREQEKLSSAKKEVLSRYANGDEEIQKELEEKWDLINIPESETTIEQRAELVAKLVGVNTKNPLNKSFNGEAPKFDNEADAKVDNAVKEVLSQFGINK